MQTYIIDVWQNESIWTWQGQAESEEAAQEAARIEFNRDRGSDYATWDDLAADQHGTDICTESPLHTAAPAMLAALQGVLDAWRDEMENDDGIAGSDAVEWLCSFYAEAQKIVATATGSPTGGAEPASPTDGTEGESQTYTAFCQQSDGRGTIWIETVEVPAGTDNPVRDAKAAAIENCADDWQYDPADVLQVIDRA